MIPHHDQFEGMQLAPIVAESSGVDLVQAVQGYQWQRYTVMVSDDRVPNNHLFVHPVDAEGEAMAVAESPQEAVRPSQCNLGDMHALIQFG